MQAGELDLTDDLVDLLDRTRLAPTPEFVEVTLVFVAVDDPRPATMCQALTAVPIASSPNGLVSR
jgi:hypothetical protein